MALGDFSEMLLPSEFAKPSSSPPGFGEITGCPPSRRSAVLLRQLNASLYHWFDYVPRSTRHVNSPIDEALESRKGVCQDFAHTMIALVRHARHSVPLRKRLPLSRRRELRTAPPPTLRMPGSRPFCPRWAGSALTPLNNLLAHNRYIRTALEDDYGRCHCRRAASIAAARKASST